MITRPSTYQSKMNGHWWLLSPRLSVARSSPGNNSGSSCAASGEFTAPDQGRPGCSVANRGSSGMVGAKRPLAPGAVRQDVERILALVSVDPGIGARATQVKLRGVRRVTLTRIRYYMYYRVS